MKLISATLVSPSRVPAAGLDAAIAVARKVSESNSRLSRDSLAVALGNKKGSGNANNKILAAQHFGLIQRGPDGAYSMTDFGRRCVSTGAREEDFKNAITRIKPFAKVIEDLGWPFSTDDAATIDGALRKAGVAAGAIVEARRILVRSIAMIPLGRPAPPADTGVLSEDDASAAESRPSQIVVRPRIRPSRSTTLPDDEPITSEVQKGADPVPFPEVPMIRGLLDAAPKLGTPWPRSQQDDFIEAMRHLIRFSYGSGE